MQRTTRTEANFNSTATEAKAFGWNTPPSAHRSPAVQGLTPWVPLQAPCVSHRTGCGPLTPPPKALRKLPPSASPAGWGECGASMWLVKNGETDRCQLPARRNGFCDSSRGVCVGWAGRIKAAGLVPYGCRGSWRENSETGCSVKPPIASSCTSPVQGLHGDVLLGGLPAGGRTVLASGPSGGQVAAAVLPLRFPEVSVGFFRPLSAPAARLGWLWWLFGRHPCDSHSREFHPVLRLSPHLSRHLPKPATLKVRHFSGAAGGALAARHSSDSSAVTSPGTARLPLPSSGSASALPGRPRPAAPRAPVPCARPPGRIPAAPAARLALPPPPGPQRHRAGPGVGESRPPAPAPSPPTRTAPSSLLSRLLAFPATRAHRPLKVLPNFSSRAGAGRGRFLRPGSLCCLPSRLRSSGSRRHPVAPGGPSPPTRAILPGLLAAPLFPAADGAPSGLGGSPFPGSVRPCAHPGARIAAEPSLPSRLLRLLPSAPPPPATGTNSLGNRGSAAAAEGQPFRAGLQGSDRAM